MRSFSRVVAVVVILVAIGVASEQCGLAQIDSPLLLKAPTVDSIIRQEQGQLSLQSVIARQKAANPAFRPPAIGTRNLGIPSGSPANKPFTYVQDTPTVSPYQNLYREDLGDAAPNYYSIVKPQLDQNNFQRQQQLRNQQVSRQMQDLQSQSPYAPQGSRQIMPTGHGTIYGYYSHFYPNMRRRR